MRKDNDKTTVTIDYSTWRKLQKLRLSNRFNTLNEVILLLLKENS